MNVTLENQILTEYKEHIELLENTKTLHPYALAEAIHYNKHKAKKQEDKIVNYLMK